ncbi:MAG TPA: hypothetical protein VJ852_00680 [Gemmatimonadaceae bacterium]|nr:hypothetical protein [Gemmatimonadaceae bacterium]
MLVGELLVSDSPLTDLTIETVRVVHTLRPLIVVMAGENEYDPYKD